MLELNYYSIHEDLNLSNFFLVTYVIMDDLYHQVIPDKIRFYRNYNQPKLSDIVRIISISFLISVIIQGLIEQDNI